MTECRSGGFWKTRAWRSPGWFSSKAWHFPLAGPLHTGLPTGGAVGGPGVSVLATGTQQLRSYFPRGNGDPAPGHPLAPSFPLSDCGLLGTFSAPSPAIAILTPDLLAPRDPRGGRHLSSLGPLCIPPGTRRPWHFHWAFPVPSSHFEACPAGRPGSWVTSPTRLPAVGAVLSR